MSQLFFVRDGIHTYLVLPAEPLFSRLPTLNNYLEVCNWLCLGWGDYRYYGAHRQTTIMGARALLLPTRAVIEIRGIGHPESSFPASARLYAIAANAFVHEAVADFVSRHFRFDKNGDLRWVRARPSGEQFFAASGIYTIANTCNNWTAKGLRVAGIRIRPSWQFLAGQVERSVQRNGFDPLSPSRGELPPSLD